MTINQAPTEGTTTNYFHWPVLQRLRNVCDQLGNYRDVVTGLQEYETMTSFFAHVVATKPAYHTVITWLGDTYRRRPMKEDFSRPDEPLHRPEGLGEAQRPRAMDR